jgi:hypothetical protein
MTTSRLSKLLEMFEEISGALSVQAMASELEIRPAQVESMVDFWINKGRIRATEESKDCGSCGLNSNCPYILKLPQTYELVSTGDDII